MDKSNYTETLPNGTSFDMIFVEGGTLMMGSEDENIKEKLANQVNVEDFFISKCLVIQTLWHAIMGYNPSHFIGADHPVEEVSWDDAKLFIQTLNESIGRTYRLPTEAEWEFSARGGNKSKNFKYSGSNKLKEIGWFKRNSHDETKPVQLKLPNELGIYDMNGNVWEWCEDLWRTKNYNGTSNEGNMAYSIERERRVLRGGSCFENERINRISERFWQNADNKSYDLGFRLAFSVPDTLFNE